MIRLDLPAARDEPLSVLLLGAHSDDIEIGCGATMLGLAAGRERLRVRWVVFGADGPREEEARRSAAFFLDGVSDAQVEVHHHRNSWFPAEWAAIKERFERLKTGFEPDLVFCHWRMDAHQDHRVIGELAWNTWRDHLILEYEIPKFEGDLGHPNLFVPVGRATAERKVRALMDHFATQRSREWFTTDTFLGLMRMRAVEAQCADEFAEAFHARKLVLGGLGRE